jgi:uncharacterized protein (TIGR02118 family)
MVADVAKIIFFLHRRGDMSREDMVGQWTGEQHRSVVWKVPGLARWTQNRIASVPGEPPCDAVGELWFESGEALQEALSSREWATAVEDAGRFLDLNKSGMVIVEEKLVPALINR